MKWCTILGLDIGGANTKAALVHFNEETIVDSSSYLEYFPFWEKIISDIPKMLKRILSNLIEKNNYNLSDVNYVSVTITAELSDAFQTKREGITTILNALEQVFDKKKLYIVGTNARFHDIISAKNNHSIIAAANWTSTSLYLGHFISNCILIDAGSTTIDIIPILNSTPVAQGKDDISRLMSHELVYTGGLRSTIPSITHFVPYKNNLVRISFEKFALISDVHRILNNISEEEYINDTADNRSKSLENCYARLARTICMDIETISKEELNIIAKYIYEKQLEIVENEIKIFYKSLIERLPKFKEISLFIITGLSANFLARKALINLGYENIKSYEDITKIPNRVSSSAFAVAGALYLQLKHKP